MQAGNLADHGQAIAGAPARVADGDEAVAVEQRAEHALREALARIRHADEQRLLAPLKAQADFAARRGKGQRVGQQVIHRALHKLGIRIGGDGGRQAAVDKAPPGALEQRGDIVRDAVQQGRQVHAVPLRLAGAGQQLAARGELAAQAQELIQPAVQLGGDGRGRRFLEVLHAVEQLTRRRHDILQRTAENGRGLERRPGRRRRLVRSVGQKQQAPLHRADGKITQRPAERQAQAQRAPARPQAERRSLQHGLQGRARIEHGGCRGVAPLDSLAVRQKNGLGEGPQDP